MSQSKPIIGVIFDFDDTLAPDSTSQLLTALGVDVGRFWSDEVGPLVEAGWDPVPAYLYRMLEWSRTGRFAEPLTRDLLTRTGASLELYPGVLGLFERLRDRVREFFEDIDLEFYVVSSGLEDLIAASAFYDQLTQVWACGLHYEAETGCAVYPRNLVSFTDKTRYLFQIEKGLIAPRSELDAFAVNRKVPDRELRIPFDRMVYVGDGHTDVPCFSLVSGRRGVALAVSDLKRSERWGRAWGFIEEQRAMHLLEVDYRPGGHTETILQMALHTLCERISLQDQCYRR